MTQITHTPTPEKIEDSPSTISAKIAALNDRFRAAIIAGDDHFADSLGKIVTRASIAEFEPEDVLAIRAKVAGFSDFNPDNDPRQEHDFGAFDHCGERIIWHIDYFARAGAPAQGDMGSDDPSDPAKTLRILTIMLADEY